MSDQPRDEEPVESPKREWVIVGEVGRNDDNADNEKIFLLLSPTTGAVTLAKK